MTDRELLRDYAEQGSESAFQTLVQHHMDLVFATALRRVGNAAAAQEITQNVFTLLARKAAWLRGEVSLVGWLHRTTLLEARQWWRGELRRQRREQIAAELGTTMKEDDSLLQSLASVLDEGLLELRETDRQALLLRYFEERNHREIGALLGTGEDAVRKRIDKALAKLISFFRRRGYAVPVIVVTAALEQAAAHAAPAGLTTLVAQVALKQAGAASLTSFGLLLAKFMALTKTQTAVACLVVAAMPIAYQWKLHSDLSRQSALLRAQLAESEQHLLAAQRLRDDLNQRALPLSSVIAQLRGRLTAATISRAPSSPNPSLWSESSPYVQVPKNLLARIHIPSLGEDGLLQADMARALGLNDQQVQQVNQSLKDFRSQYQTLAAAHTHPSTTHPTSMHIQPLSDQKSFLREAFTEEYQPLLTGLKTSLEQTMGQSNSEYFWKNTPGKGAHEEFDPDYGPLAKRITIIRPAKEQPGGGPYYLGEEYQDEQGHWFGGQMSSIDAENRVSLPQIQAVIAEWKQHPAAP